MMTLELTEYQVKLYNEQVAKTKHIRMGEKTTVVLLTLFNGFEIVGTSACVNPDDYDLDTGIHYALLDALKKLDEYVGFLRQQELHKLATAEPTPKRTFGLKDAENITFNITVENDKSGKELADKIFAHLAKYKGTGKA